MTAKTLRTARGCLDTRADTRSGALGCLFLLTAASHDVNRKLHWSVIHLLSQYREPERVLEALECHRGICIVIKQCIHVLVIELLVKDKLIGVWEHALHARELVHLLLQP